MAKSVFFFGDGKAEGDPKRRDQLGGKGAGLAEMTSLGLPVPPGFTLATDVCNAYSRTQRIPDEVRGEVEAALARLEKSMGARLGDPQAPLLVSVPLRRARVDARDDGHRPQPGTERRRRRRARGEDQAARASRSTRTAVSSRCTPPSRSGLSKEPFDRVLDEARARVAHAKGIDRTRLNAEELKRQRARRGHPRRGAEDDRPGLQGSS